MTFLSLCTAENVSCSRENSLTFLYKQCVCVWVCHRHRPNRFMLSVSFTLFSFRHHRPPTLTTVALLCQMLPTSSARVAVSTPTHEKYELLLRWTSQRRREGAGERKEGRREGDEGKVFNRHKKKALTKRLAILPEFHKAFRFLWTWVLLQFFTWQHRFRQLSRLLCVRCTFVFKDLCLIHIYNRHILQDTHSCRHLQAV